MNTAVIFNATNTSGKEHLKTRIYDALDVARFLINYCYAEDIYLSNLKLQKVLYFIQLQFLQINPQKPCFKELMTATSFGPICKPVYREFLRYGSHWIPQVKSYYINKDNIWYLKKVEYNDNVLLPQDKEEIINVLFQCDTYSTTQLTQISKNQYPNEYSFQRHSKDNFIANESLLKFLQLINGGKK